MEGLGISTSNGSGSRSISASSISDRCRELERDGWVENLRRFIAILKRQSMTPVTGSLKVPPKIGLVMPAELEKSNDVDSARPSTEQVRRKSSTIQPLALSNDTLHDHDHDHAALLFAASVPLPARSRSSSSSISATDSDSDSSSSSGFDDHDHEHPHPHRQLESDFISDWDSDCGDDDHERADNGDRNGMKHGNEPSFHFRLEHADNESTKDADDAHRRVVIHRAATGKEDASHGKISALHSKDDETQGPTHAQTDANGNDQKMQADRQGCYQVDG